MKDHLTHYDLFCFIDGTFSNRSHKKLIEFHLGKCNVCKQAVKNHQIVEMHISSSAEKFEFSEDFTKKIMHEVRLRSENKSVISKRVLWLSLALIEMLFAGAIAVVLLLNGLPSQAITWIFSEALVDISIYVSKQINFSSIQMIAWIISLFLLLKTLIVEKNLLRA